MQIGYRKTVINWRISCWGDPQCDCEQWDQRIKCVVTERHAAFSDAGACANLEEVGMRFGLLVDLHFLRLKSVVGPMIIAGRNR